ncbi:extensin [Streptomyces sp. NPDC087844]|uniref:extensin n=1 Tax=Streptomyces sp. NPDC087844 TaxID=3365805 RepID=UPI0037FF0BBE
MRALTPARALAPSLTPTAPPAHRRPALPAPVPLRRPAPTPSRYGASGAGPAAVQRAVTPGAPAGRAVPLLAATRSAPAGPVRTVPAAQPLTVPNAYPAPAVVQRQAVAAPRTATAPAATAPAPAPAPPRPAPTPVPASVQRALLPTSARATTAVSAVTVHGGSSHGSSGSGSADDPPPYKQGGPPPAYSAVAKGQFDPRSLTDFQLDELTHRLISRITRMIRTELRLDRERIGKLRDPRR